MSTINGWHVAVAIIGISVTLSGVVPMALALSVSNALIDEGGIEPGELEIMDAWDAWAFSPRFVALATSGTCILCVLLRYTPQRDRKRFMVAISSILGGAVFLAIVIHGWCFLDLP